MLIRLHTFLPLSMVVLSILACSRTEQLTPTSTASTNSFRYSNRLINCEAIATVSASYDLNATGPNSFSTADSTEIVSIQLNAISQDTANAPWLNLTYERPKGRDEAPYQLTIVCYASDNPTEGPAFFEHITGTLRATGKDYFEGSFLNTQPGSSPLSEGSFTHVRVVKRY